MTYSLNFVHKITTFWETMCFLVQQKCKGGPTHLPINLWTHMRSHLEGGI